MVKILFRVIVLWGLLSPLQFDKPITSQIRPDKDSSKNLISVTPPHEAGPCAIISISMDLNGATVDFHYPGADPCSDGMTAPYPVIVYAHGFSMFGISDGRTDNQGIGEHLASWGYIVAIQTLPDDAEERIGFMINLLNYLELAQQDPGSPLYGKIDTDKMAAAGYSLGGATALATTARDDRIRVVVALDPVYHEGGPSGEEGDLVWDPAAEAPNIVVPSGILGAPADSCNAQSDYQDIYPLIGASLKASYQIVDASHCVFPVPGNPFCSLTCGGTIEAYMTQLSLKYVTAWFNFHLQSKTQYYSYLYGDHADEDIEAGLIIRQVETFPGTAPNNVEIDGPIAGLPETIYQFSASVEPITTTLPITVVWSATNQGVITRTIELLSDQVEMAWSETGNKTITATVMNSNGQAIDIHEINIYEAAHADFEAYPVSGVAPLNVTFTNTSVGDNSSNYWEFGDGHTSTLENPTHIYSDTGSYTVTLTIDGSDGIDQEIKAEYINVYANQLFLPLVVR